MSFVFVVERFSDVWDGLLKFLWASGPAKGFGLDIQSLLNMFTIFIFPRTLGYFEYFIRDSEREYNFMNYQIMSCFE